MQYIHDRWERCSRCEGVVRESRRSLHEGLNWIDHVAGVDVFSSTAFDKEGEGEEGKEDGGGVR